MQSRSRSFARGIDLHWHEAHFIARFQLPDLPEIRLDDRHRTNEAAEARTVGAEDHGHVPGEIDRADRIRIVVNIRWMQPGFTAVLARPFRLRPDQAHAGAARVEMDLPLGREELLDIARTEVLRRPVRAVDDAQRANGSDVREEGQGCAWAGIVKRIQM